jgi:uncharacterized protein (TIGR02594 family)
MSTLKLGSSGDAVRQIQILLNEALALKPRLKADGNFGKKTGDAVKLLQQKRGLDADGEVGPKTRKALGLKPVPFARPDMSKSGTSWIDIATAEIGIKENSLPGEHENRIVEYHQTTTLKATTDETPWCSSFVNWVVKQAGGTGTNSAAAKSWMDWGKASEPPDMGCIVVIKKKTPGFSSATGSSSGWHVGFYISKSATHVRILGGNQGDQVKYSSFALTSYDIKGCRVAL